MSYTFNFLEQAKKKNPNETEFHQAMSDSDGYIYNKALSNDS